MSSKYGYDGVYTVKAPWYFLICKSIWIKASTNELKVNIPQYSTVFFVSEQSFAMQVLF